MNRWLAMLAPFRWWRSLCSLMGGARVHPCALLLGRSTQVGLARGCVLGARVRVDPGSQGHVMVGKRVWIAADVEVQTETSVIIGDGTSVQRRSTINGTTRLGRGCILAPNVFISSGTHPFRFIPHLHIREQERQMSADATDHATLDRPVWVQDDCWLGTNAVVLPGVIIGKGSIVGANAVVTKDIPPYSVVAGAPARVVGTRLDWSPPLSIDPSREEDHPYLLDARIRNESNGACIEVVAGAPMLAALKASNDTGRVEITWRAALPVSILIRQRCIDLPSGEGRLVLQADDLHIDRGVALCEIAIGTDSPPNAKLDVSRLQVC
jgi:acetyltransferase-like isoleucine patch superfamily enzyme